MSATIRPAEPRDIPEVWNLILGLAEYEKLTHLLTGTEDQLQRWLFEEPVVEGLVAEQDGQIVGYALFLKNFSTFKVLPGIWLEDLFVLPDRRGQGIGNGLISRVIQIAKERGYGRVEWSVLDWNQSAIDFYEGLGASILAEWKLCRITL